MSEFRYDLAHKGGRLKVLFTPGQIRLMAQVHIMLEEVTYRPVIDVQAHQLKEPLQRMLVRYLDSHDQVKGFKDWYLELVFEGAASALGMQRRAVL